MNTNSLDKFSLKINSKQFLAAFLIIILTLIIIFLSFRWKNKVTFEYEGKVLNNNILEITNLSYLDVKTIIDSKLKILDRKITKDNIAIEKINADIDFTNMLDIKNISFEIFDQPLKTYGTIQKNSETDIHISADKLSITPLNS